MRQASTIRRAIGERGEDVLVEGHSSRIRPLRDFDEGVLHRLAGRDVVPFDLVIGGGHRRTALLVSSVPLSETIISGLPRTAMMASSSRITRRPEQREVRYRRQALAVEVVDHVEQPEPPSVAQLVADEVE